MLEGLVAFFIFLVVVVGIALLILWIIRKFMPELYTPARYVVGVVVVVVLLMALLGVIRGQPLWTP